MLQARRQRPATLPVPVAPGVRPLGRLRRGWIALLLVLLVCCPAPAAPGHAAAISSEALAWRSPWSRPASYPLALRPRLDLYRPSAPWIGRLILPAVAELADPQAPAGDWVWIELEQAPGELQAWIGRRLRLRWAERPDLQRLVAAVTTDIRLDQRARRAAAAGNVVPSRLDGRRRVGPLQSLAGARPFDDLSVALEGVSWREGELRIARPPLQISGRWQGLVQVEGPLSGAPAPSPDLWWVRHYNRASGAFDGPRETVRLPRLPPDRFGRRMLDPAGLIASPWNRQGWLIQGAPASDGLFTVQALEPRALLTPEPERRIGGLEASLAYLQRGSWSPAQMERGSLHRTALLPQGATPPRWAPGERALLMHLFGGIGGADGERVSLGTVTGHFAFGEAQVVADPFSGQPRLAIRYHQIYANNPNGIVAGSQDWSAYAGSLQRGWIGTRPFSDVLIPMPGEVLDAIALQAEILAARYRSGDGTGVALVSASTSCVQDSAQALWIAIRQLRQRKPGPAEATAEADRLGRLGDALDHLLTPFGRVRGDWAHNGSLALAQAPGRFQASERLRDGLLSWRSLLPRGAHDRFASELLRLGLPLQVLRTNQIPGTEPRLRPVAPTTLLGQLPPLGTLLSRLADGLLPVPGPVGPTLPLLVLLLYAPLALGLGWRSGFLSRRWRWPPLPRLLRRALALALMPAFGEELLFRGLLLPHPLEGVSTPAMAAWIGLSTVLFVAYHPLAARLWYQQGRGVFEDRRFLLQSALLSLACSLAYVLSGSLWWAVLLHGMAVLLWLEALGGQRRLEAAVDPLPGFPA